MNNERLREFATTWHKMGDQYWAEGNKLVADAYHECASALDRLLPKKLGVPERASREPNRAQDAQEIKKLLADYRNAVHDTKAGGKERLDERAHKIAFFVTRLDIEKALVDALEHFDETHPVHENEGTWSSLVAQSEHARRIGYLRGVADACDIAHLRSGPKLREIADWLAALVPVDVLAAPSASGEAQPCPGEDARDNALAIEAAAALYEVPGEFEIGYRHGYPGERCSSHFGERFAPVGDSLTAWFNNGYAEGNEDRERGLEPDVLRAWSRYK